MSTDNPYVHAGGVHQLSTPRTSRALLIGAWVHLLFALWTGVGEYRAMLHFRELFDAFGADLPLLTRFMAACPWLGLLFGVTALWPAIAISWRSLPDRQTQRRARRILLMHVAATLILLALFIVGAYLPMFKMGQVVGA